MLFVCAILGLIADGLAGIMFIIRFILIKVGGKEEKHSFSPFLKIIALFLKMQVNFFPCKLAPL